jgi:hypothetical protein
MNRSTSGGLTFGLQSFRQLSDFVRIEHPCARLLTLSVYRAGQEDARALLRERLKDRKMRGTIANGGDQGGLAVKVDESGWLIPGYGGNVHPPSKSPNRPSINKDCAQSRFH